MKKIKVLIVAGAMNSGGQENQLMHILRNADKSKYQIDFTSTEENPFYKSEIEALGGKCYKIPYFSIKNPLKHCKAIYNILKQGKYDVIHSNELFHSGIVMLVARFAKTPCRISHSHSSMDSYGRMKIIQKIYHFIMRLLINNFSTERIGCSTMSGKFLFGDKKNFKLLFNSVDTEKFLSDGINQEDELHDDGFKAVLHAGHVVPLKNQELLIEVAEILKKSDRKIHIYCAGEGNEDYVRELNERIQERELQKYITLLGLRRDVPRLMKMADAFVLPSKFEGMPLTVIEAQASGLNCVCADTFSHEVDFGTGQIEWLDINAVPEIWANVLENAVGKGRADKNEIIKAIERGGFDSKLYAEKITKIYSENYKGFSK